MPSVQDHRSHLPIARVSLIGAGVTEEREFVQFPRFSSSIPVAHCLACEHYAALRRDPETGGCAVLCEVRAQPGSATPLTLPRLDVAHVMTRDVLSVRPDLSLDAALLLFLEHHARSFPVVDHDQQLVGMLHEPDLQLAVQTNRGHEGRVASVMLPLALTVPESMPLTRAAAIMAFEGVSSLVVLAPGGDVVGLLSTSDILSWLARADGYLTRVRRSGSP